VEAGLQAKGDTRMIHVDQVERWDAVAFGNLLKQHQLLTEPMLHDPMVIPAICANSIFRVIHDDAPLALVVESLNTQPEVLDLMVIPEDKAIGKRKDELRALATALRAIWFDHAGFRRVQSMVPISRVNMQRILRSLGFVEETRRKMGVRNLVRLGSKPEAILIYGLIPSDPLPETVDTVEIATV